MKKHFLNATLWAFLLLALCAMGCSNDDGYPDVDGQSPTIALAAEHIQSGAGRRFTIEGELQDKDGISSIILQCADLNLNKTIDLIQIYGAPQETYQLSYYYDLDRNEIGERFTVKITVNDVGGRSLSKDVLVTMDGDFAAPSFTTTPDATVTVLIKTETKFNLRFSVADDRALDHVIINIPGVDGFDNRRVEAAGKPSFNFAEKIVFPNIVNTYDITITAVDKMENSTVAKSVLNVSEMPDFSKMYLADVATVEDLNSDIFGVPMLITRTAPYQYKAKYYCRKAGTEIFFLPQKSDFAPICFGLDPDDSNKLTDDPETAKPIVLDQANVYYEITFDVMTGSYALNTYSVSQATNRLPQAIGSDYYLNPAEPQFVVPFQIGVLDNSGNMPISAGGPGGVAILKQDAGNPHLFYTEEFAMVAGQDDKAKDKKLNFIIHNKHDWGWWDYCLWRLDNEADPELFIYGGADAKPKPQDIWGKPLVKTGTYKFWFDAHLERGKLVKVN